MDAQPRELLKRAFGLDFTCAGTLDDAMLVVKAKTRELHDAGVVAK